MSRCRAVLLWVALIPTGGHAQVVERHLPPAVVDMAPALPAPEEQLAEDDDRPIGPPLEAIVIIGAHDPVRQTVAPGIDLAAAGRLDTAGTRRRLSAFLNRPISRRLVARIQAAITLAYRRAGFPFVAVSIPEQEITGGILQVRVVEFVAGRLSVAGTRRTPRGFIESRVRWQRGDPVDGGALSRDLAWLNRNPFRQVGAAFSPGRAFGETDLALTAHEVRPWRVYAGYAPSGSRSGGRDRIFAGVQAAGPYWLPDSVASYQVTIAPEFVRYRYVSHAGRLDLPIAARRAIELSIDHVWTRQPVQAFVSRQAVDEASVGLRSSLPTVAGPVPLVANWRLGAEFRRIRGLASFGGVTIQRTAYGVAQGFVGYAAALSGLRRDLTIEATLHAGRSDGERPDPASHGGERLYVYVNGRLSAGAELGSGASLQADLLFQATGTALPQTEQVAVGGPGLVRGYLFDDGAFDSGAVLRTTLTGGGWRLMPDGTDRLRPLVFLDLGHGWVHATERTGDAVAAGAGFDYRLRTTLQVGVTHACALTAGASTRAGRCRLEARMTLMR